MSAVMNDCGTGRCANVAEENKLLSLRHKVRHVRNKRCKLSAYAEQIAKILYGYRTFRRQTKGRNYRAITHASAAGGHDSVRAGGRRQPDVQTTY